ncbi:MAG: ferrous iron transport protein A [Lachnospiraceae bacterium]|nr:ferrous iron transport protein A [Lachnospiraceae bacterium]
MIPLSMADQGEDMIVRKVGGKPEVRQHLENLGFVVGSNIQLISELNGNVIVNVKESRIAISKEMAMKIFV